MRILLLTHAFNSLTQRLFVELRGLGHVVSVELDIADSTSEEAVRLFVPDLVIAPYLRRAIPESIWSQYVCFIVHPGIVGDRGPSALDWAVQSGAHEWGVTVLQAEAEMDAGAVWASEPIAMRHAAKASIYRREVTDAAHVAVARAVARFELGAQARPLASFDCLLSGWHPLMRQEDRALDWQRDTTELVLRKVRAADSFPGVRDRWFDREVRVFDAHPEGRLRGVAGAVLGYRDGALLRATTDGAVWIGQMIGAEGIKLSALQVFADKKGSLTELARTGLWEEDYPTWQEISYDEQGAVGNLRFNFYNGAMSTDQCMRLRQALNWVQKRPVRVLVLWGGQDFWSNGIHLGAIEAVSLTGGSAAQASWDNIQAMDDVAQTILENDTQLTVAAVAGNAGAGGCFLARAAWQVWVRDGVILNPHYKNMGNLYGSEYWTYTLPQHVGVELARQIMQDRLPMSGERAARCGFADACLDGDVATFGKLVEARAQEIAHEPHWTHTMRAHRQRRVGDESIKPLQAYRNDELAHMHRNFFGFDPSYHVARHHFVRKSPASWTPRHLALHRQPGWSASK